MFKYFDVKNRNYLDCSDLKEAFSKMGRELPSLKVHHLFQEMD
jgi:Ca2+-binding EF-hand superfamily protein